MDVDHVVQMDRDLLLIDSEVQKQGALASVRMLSDRIESYTLADEPAPPYHLHTWREILGDIERRIERGWYA